MEVFRSSWFIYHFGIEFLCRSLQVLCSRIVSDTRVTSFDGAWSSMYFIEGTVNLRCWHLYDDTILDTVIRSRLGSGSQKDSLGSSCECPNKWPKRRLHIGV